MLTKKEIAFRSSCKFLSNKEGLAELLGVNLEEIDETQKDFLNALSQEEQKQLVILAKDEVLKKRQSLKASYQQIEDDTRQQGETLDWLDTAQQLLEITNEIVDLLVTLGVFEDIKKRLKDKNNKSDKKA